MPSDHPNALVRRKGRPNAWRRIVNLWPLLVWLGAIVVAFWAYSQGVVFRRMNGAVDPYQENVSPLEEGYFRELAEGIVRGSHVEANQVVAYMSDTVLEEKISILTQEIETRRTERLRNYNDDILKVESELRKIEGDLVAAQAETEATKKEIDSMVDRMKALNLNTEAQRLALTGPIVSEFNIKIAKSNAIVGVRVKDKTQVENDRDRLVQERDLLAKESEPSKFAERNQAAQLAQLIKRKARLTLHAARAGTIDRILKEPGEFVKQGEGVLKIVGSPTQIIGFLAQDQITQLSQGQKVWITPTSDRTKIYPSKVLYLAPRMNSLPDSTGPTPNSRLFGRDVLCDYPVDSHLLPGQTVIIWLEPPGDVPLLNRWMSNRDADAGK